MSDTIKKSLLVQLLGSIKMLEQTIVACPHEFWNDAQEFWYKAYHTLFYLDYYLADNPDNFLPPAPFTLSEFDPAGAKPPCVYTKEELIDYLNYCRAHAIASIPSKNLEQRFVNAYRDYSHFEILVYNIKHVQHHVGMLTLLLRQNCNATPGWVSTDEA